MDCYVYCSGLGAQVPLDPSACATVKLSQPLNAVEGYEIALLDVHLCVGFANVTKVGLSLDKYDPATGGLIKTIEARVPDGSYEELKEIYDRLNESIVKQISEKENQDDWAK